MKTFHKWLVEQKKKGRIDENTGTARFLNDYFNDKTLPFEKTRPKGMDAGDYRAWLKDYYYFYLRRGHGKGVIGDLEEAWYEYVYDLTKELK